MQIFIKKMKNMVKNISKRFIVKELKSEQSKENRLNKTQTTKQVESKNPKTNKNK